MFEPKDKSFDKDSLQTPRWMFNWLDSVYNFDVDLCASDDHHFCDHYYTKENSCLNGHSYRAGFCNPPYSNIQPFLIMAIDNTLTGSTTVMLIPEPNGEARSELIVKYASEIIHFNKRINFIRPDNGEEYKGNNRGSIIAVFAPKLTGMANHGFMDLDEIKEMWS